jgi:peptidoglycan/xylan/chitin deacetylase (PgdA/CDA1 family)
VVYGVTDDSRIRVALTFDAEHEAYPPGPPEQCGQLLDLLAAAGVRATFFQQGRWAQSWPSLASRIAADGHLVGLHCNSHVPYPWLTAKGVAADLAAGREAVTEAAGVDPAPWFRFPYGEGAGDPALVTRVRDEGFTSVYWNVDARDWSPSSEPEALVDAIVQGAQEANGTAVVLLHSWPAVTAAALPVLLARFAELGAELVTVDQLAADELTALAP